MRHPHEIHSTALETVRQIERWQRQERAWRCIRGVLIAAAWVLGMVIYGVTVYYGLTLLSWLIGGF